MTSSDWFYDQVVGAVQYGWITGYTDGTFRPEATITRAEVTAITTACWTGRRTRTTWTTTPASCASSPM